MTRCAKNFGEHGPCTPGYAYDSKSISVVNER